MTIAAGTSNTTIGAETSGIGNLNIISGNLGDGVSITSSSGNNLSFDYFGVDLNNKIALPQQGQRRVHPRGVRQSREPGRDRNNGGYGILTDTGVEQQRLVLRLDLRQRQGRHRPADQRLAAAGAAV